MTNRGYDARHQAAMEIFERMQAGRIDGQRAARAIHRRHGALGSFVVDFVMGDLWSRPQLSPRDRSLIVIGLLAAQGSEEIALHVEFGLNHGLRREEIDEILLHVAASAGFPMAMFGAGRVDETLNRLDGLERQPPRSPAQERGDAERRAEASVVVRALMSGHDDRDADAMRRSFVSDSGEIGGLSFDWEFGEVWSRHELARRDRSLVTIALAGWLALEDDLALQVQGGLRHGLTPSEIVEVMVQLSVYAGFPRARAGHRIVQQVLADQGLGGPAMPTARL